MGSLFPGWRLILLMLLCYQSASAQQTNARNSQLETVREQIKEVQSYMDNAHKKIDVLQAELRENEIFAGNIFISIRSIEKNIDEKLSRLSELRKIKTDHETQLGAQRKLLAQRFRVAYMLNRGNYLKLVLNQENPAHVGRMLAYHNYDSQRQAEQINTVQEKLKAVGSIENNIRLETTQLQNLKTEQIAKNKATLQSRMERKAILIQLEGYLQKKDLELQALHKQEKEISELLKNLQSDADNLFEDNLPFDTLKGKLDWPVDGKLLARFGGNKKGNELKWRGVVIDAGIGHDVRAVSSGKVIFADWFRNLGLLIIIDHSGGYMSLYGYNQSLLKKTGEWVLPSEIIATVGDSGGQSYPSVYFEIRYQGVPVNPAFWCKK